MEVTITVTNVGLDGMAGQYDRDEAIAAVVDYFNGTISKEEAIEVVRVYFAGPGAWSAGEGRSEGVH